MACIVKTASSRVHGYQGVPRMGVLGGKVVEGLLGILYGTALGVKINEAVGEEGVESASCFDQV